MNSSKRTLLYLSNTHFEAYSWNGKTLSDAVEFPLDQDGQTRFSAYLQQHTAPAHLLTDIIEEDFRHEAIPHLNARHRRNLIERRFEQYFRSTPFRQARLQGRNTNGRRDDEILFSALTNPQHIQPWQECLSRNRIPLIGIYSLPDISDSLIGRLKSKHILLLSWEKHAGLRQSYFHNRKLHLSRLTPLNDTVSLSESVAIEIPRMLNYLKSLNLSQNEAIETYVICRTQDFTGLHDVLGKHPDLQCTHLDIQMLSDTEKVSRNRDDSDATPLFLHLLARHPPASQYANRSHAHHYLVWQIRKVLWLLAVISLSAGLLWGTSSAWQGYQYVSRTTPLLEQTTHLTREIGSLKQDFPDTGASATEMKSTVTLMHALDDTFPSPEIILSPLADVLDQFTQVRTLKLSWQTEKTSDHPTRKIDLDGELMDFGNDHRSAITYLENFQQQLRLRGYTVTSRKMPVDISPQGSISGGKLDEPDQLTRFSLQLIWEPS